MQEDEDVRKVIGDNLNRLCLTLEVPDSREVSLPRLAKQVALSRTSSWYFENGKSGMTVATLTRLKEALNCSWGDLPDGCESKIVKERKRIMGEVRKKKIARQGGFAGFLRRSAEFIPPQRIQGERFAAAE